MNDDDDLGQTDDEPLTEDISDEALEAAAAGATAAFTFSVQIFYCRFC
jgi:hypothetical protein